MDKSTSDPANGLIAGLVGVARNGLGLLLSRLELAALELSEVRNQFLKIAVIFSLSIVAIWFSVAYATVTIVALAWESWGWKILLVLTSGFAIISAGFVWYLVVLLKQEKLALTSTMRELKADRDILL